MLANRCVRNVCIGYANCTIGGRTRRRDNDNDRNDNKSRELMSLQLHHDTDTNCFRQASSRTERNRPKVRNRNQKDQQVESMFIHEESSQQILPKSYQSTNISTPKTTTTTTIRNQVVVSIQWLFLNSCYLCRHCAIEIIKQTRINTEPIQMQATKRQRRRRKLSQQVLPTHCRYILLSGCATLLFILIYSNTQPCHAFRLPSSTYPTPTATTNIENWQLRVVNDQNRRTRSSFPMFHSSGNNSNDNKQDSEVESIFKMSDQKWLAKLLQPQKKDEQPTKNRALVFPLSSQRRGSDLFLNVARNVVATIVGIPPPNKRKIAIDSDDRILDKEKQKTVNAVESTTSGKKLVFEEMVSSRRETKENNDSENVRLDVTRKVVASIFGLQRSATITGNQGSFQNSDNGRPLKPSSETIEPELNLQSSTVKSNDQMTTVGTIHKAMSEQTQTVTTTTTTMLDNIFQNQNLPFSKLLFNSNNNNKSNEQQRTNATTDSAVNKSNEDERSKDPKSVAATSKEVNVSRDMKVNDSLDKQSTIDQRIQILQDLKKRSKFNRRGDSSTSSESFLLPTPLEEEEQVYANNETSKMEEDRLESSGTELSDSISSKTIFPNSYLSSVTTIETTAKRVEEKVVDLTTNNNKNTVGQRVPYPSFTSSTWQEQNTKTYQNPTEQPQQEVIVEQEQPTTTTPAVSQGSSLYPKPFVKKAWNVKSSVSPAPSSTQVTSSDIIKGVPSFGASYLNNLPISGTNNGDDNDDIDITPTTSIGETKQSFVRTQDTNDIDPTAHKETPRYENEIKENTKFDKAESSEQAESFVDTLSSFVSDVHKQVRSSDDVVQTLANTDDAKVQLQDRAIINGQEQQQTTSMQPTATLMSSNYLAYMSIPKDETVSDKSFGTETKSTPLLNIEFEEPEISDLTTFSTFKALQTSNPMQILSTNQAAISDANEILVDKDTPLASLNTHASTNASTSVVGSTSCYQTTTSFEGELDATPKHVDAFPEQSEITTEDKQTDANDDLSFSLNTGLPSSTSRPFVKKPWNAKSNFSTNSVGTTGISRFGAGYLSTIPVDSDSVSSIENAGDGETLSNRQPILGYTESKEGDINITSLRDIQQQEETTMKLQRQQCLPTDNTGMQPLETSNVELPFVNCSGSKTNSQGAEMVTSFATATSSSSHFANGHRLEILEPNDTPHHSSINQDSESFTATTDPVSNPPKPFVKKPWNVKSAVQSTIAAGGSGLPNFGAGYLNNIPGPNSSLGTTTSSSSGQVANEYEVDPLVPDDAPHSESYTATTDPVSKPPNPFVKKPWNVKSIDQTTTTGGISGLPSFGTGYLNNIASITALGPTTNISGQVATDQEVERLVPVDAVQQRSSNPSNDSLTAATDPVSTPPKPFVKKPWNVKSIDQTTTTGGVSGLPSFGAGYLNNIPAMTASGSTTSISGQIANDQQLDTLVPTDASQQHSSNDSFTAATDPVSKAPKPFVKKPWNIKSIDQTRTADGGFGLPSYGAAYLNHIPNDLCQECDGSISQDRKTMNPIAGTAVKASEANAKSNFETSNSDDTHSHISMESKDSSVCSNSDQGPGGSVLNDSPKRSSTEPNSIAIIDTATIEPFVKPPWNTKQLPTKPDSNVPSAAYLTTLPTVLGQQEDSRPASSLAPTEATHSFQDSFWESERNKFGQQSSSSTTGEVKNAVSKKTDVSSSRQFIKVSWDETKGKVASTVGVGESASFPIGYNTVDNLDAFATSSASYLEKVTIESAPQHLGSPPHAFIDRTTQQDCTEGFGPTVRESDAKYVRQRENEAEMGGQAQSSSFFQRVYDSTADMSGTSTPVAAESWDAGSAGMTTRQDESVLSNGERGVLASLERSYDPSDGRSSVVVNNFSSNLLVNKQFDSTLSTNAAAYEPGPTFTDGDNLSELPKHAPSEYFTNNGLTDPKLNRYETSHGSSRVNGDLPGKNFIVSELHNVISDDHVHELPSWTKVDSSESIGNTYSKDGLKYPSTSSTGVSSRNHVNFRGQEQIVRGVAPQLQMPENPRSEVKSNTASFPFQKESSQIVRQEGNPYRGDSDQTAPGDSYQPSFDSNIRQKTNVSTSKRRQPPRTYGPSNDISSLMNVDQLDTNSSNEQQQKMNVMAHVPTSEGFRSRNPNDGYFRNNQMYLDRQKSPFSTAESAQAESDTRIPDRANHKRNSSRQDLFDDSDAANQERHQSQLARNVRIRDDARRDTEQRALDDKYHAQSDDAIGSDRIKININPDRHDEVRESSVSFRKLFAAPESALDRNPKRRNARVGYKGYRLLYVRRGRKNIRSQQEMPLENQAPVDMYMNGNDSSWWSEHNRQSIPLAQDKVIRVPHQESPSSNLGIIINDSSQSLNEKYNYDESRDDLVFNDNTSRHTSHSMSLDLQPRDGEIRVEKPVDMFLTGDNSWWSGSERLNNPLSQDLVLPKISSQPGRPFDFTERQPPIVSEPPRLHLQAPVVPEPSRLHFQNFENIQEEEPEILSVASPVPEISDDEGLSPPVHVDRGRLWVENILKNLESSRSSNKSGKRENSRRVVGNILDEAISRENLVPNISSLDHAVVEKIPQAGIRDTGQLPTEDLRRVVAHTSKSTVKSTQTTTDQKLGRETDNVDIFSTGVNVPKTSENEEWRSGQEVITTSPHSSTKVEHQQPQPQNVIPLSKDSADNLKMDNLSIERLIENGATAKKFGALDDLTTSTTAKNNQDTIMKKMTKEEIDELKRQAREKIEEYERKIQQISSTVQKKQQEQ